MITFSSNRSKAVVKLQNNFLGSDFACHKFSINRT